MRLVRSRDTTPELLLRKALRAAGLRFKTYATNLPGKPDIVIESKRLAIFIDGAVLQPQQEPRPVANATTLQPPATWPVTDIGS